MASELSETAKLIREKERLYEESKQTIEDSIRRLELAEANAAALVSIL